MRRCPRAGVTLALSLGLCSLPLHAATISSATPAELRAQVARLQALVAGCAASAGSTPAACDPNSVGNDFSIGKPPEQGYEVHWDWLRDALKKSGAADPAKRGSSLNTTSARLASLAAELDNTASPREAAAAAQQLAKARADAASVLARAEFHRDVHDSWWDHVRQKLGDWFFKFFEGLGRVGAAAPWLGTVLLWLIYVAAAVGLLFFLLRSWNRQRLQVSMAGAPLQTSAWDREATDWARLAEQHAAAREWREAVHCLYWAAIVSLEARRAWRHNPTRTPREYVRLLKPGSPQQRGLNGLTSIFERVWYGLREARVEEYTEARSLYDALATGAAGTADSVSSQPPSLTPSLGEGGMA